MTPQLISTRLAAQIHRRTKEFAYTDTAVYIAQSSGSLDEYGQPTPSTIETEGPCSFTDKPKMEHWTAEADIESIEAEIRFSFVAPEKGGRFRVTKRFNETITSRTYEVVGIQNRGTFGYVCALKVVTI